jgi:hypothetical protein
MYNKITTIISLETAEAALNNPESTYKIINPYDFEPFQLKEYKDCRVN